jgi:hypothetical protein
MSLLWVCRVSLVLVTHFSCGAVVVDRFDGPVGVFFFFSTTSYKVVELIVPFSLDLIFVGFAIVFVFSL